MKERRQERLLKKKLKGKANKQKEPKKQRKKKKKRKSRPSDADSDDGSSNSDSDVDPIWAAMFSGKKQPRSQKTLAGLSVETVLARALSRDPPR